MASTSRSMVFSRVELTRGGFSRAADNLRNVILMLQEAGLSYVLEEPSKLLNEQVVEFFENARIKEARSTIKSKVAGVKVKMNSLYLNRFLRMPTDVVEESISSEDTDMALAWCAYQGRKTSAIKKNGMNEEGRFLADIIDKVF